jgi:hypothetical protein
MADALLGRAEADLRWLDLCEARLAQRPSHAGNGTTPFDEQGNDERDRARQVGAHHRTERRREVLRIVWPG